MTDTTDKTDKTDVIDSVSHSSGRVVGPVRASYLVVEQCFTWYRGNWKATVFSSVGMPVLFLLAMGYGFGSQVRTGSVPGGVSYLMYLAPALLPNGAVQTATFECTYPILSGFAWSKIFHSVTATPVTPGQVVAGWLLWLGSRLVVAGVAFVAVAAALGAVTGPGILLSMVFGVLTGLAFGAPLVAFSATVGTSGNAFNVVFRFILVPMSLFAGTFFPISQLPAWVRPVAWLTPLWHGTELARSAAFGTLTPLWTLVHVGYLLAMLVVGMLLATWRFRLRLTR
jgi:lipooligosaccharide transport system permease protein